MKILVTGGAGYIGSHTVRLLVERGHEVLVLDNLSHGHRAAVDPRARLVEGSTGNQPLVKDLLCQQGTEAVLHLAADIDVGESVGDPGQYYLNNFANTLRLLEAMREAKVKRIVLSSTAAVYGDGNASAIDEHQPRAPVNPYGRSKMMAEMAIEDFHHAFGLGYAHLRYFNVAGAAPDGSLGEDHHPEHHLIPRLLAAARDQTPVPIFGTDYPTRDGSCVRDYVHVMDLAAAHLLLLENLHAGEAHAYNLGSEQGFTVREVLAACEAVTKRKILAKVEARRPGDPPILVASSQRIRTKLGWQPQYPRLEEMVAHAWRWHSDRPEGYATG